MHPIVLVNVALTLVVAGAAYWRMASSEPTPADVFMQSVAAEDGALGWSQLCPTVQAQLPVDVLEQQTQQLRTSHAESGVTLTINHVGDWPRTSGGEIRVYVATEQAPDGSTGQKTYVLQTEASGCVESVQ
ncbi:MAG: hypothetical protein JO020_15130 [Chloroflexi bacterium]|nr:hypothetical protein [Chloroflexota bacterium]